MPELFSALVELLVVSEVEKTWKRVTLIVGLVSSGLGFFLGWLVFA